MEKQIRFNKVMSFINNKKVGLKLIVIVAWLFLSSFFSNPLFAGFKEIEGELKDALLSGHSNELTDNDILPADLLNLYIIDKPVKLYGFSPESPKSNDWSSQFKQIEFNEAYRKELTGNIQNFIAVLKGKPFLLCDILVKENSLKLLGFRMATEGLDLSQIINSENNQIFMNVSQKS